MNKIKKVKEGTRERRKRLWCVCAVPRVCDHLTTYDGYKKWCDYCNRPIYTGEPEDKLMKWLAVFYVQARNGDSVKFDIREEGFPFSRLYSQKSLEIILHDRRAELSDKYQDILQIAIGALADISGAEDMTLKLARRKAGRIYREVSRMSEYMRKKLLKEKP